MAKNVTIKFKIEVSDYFSTKACFLSAGFTTDPLVQCCNLQLGHVSKKASKLASLCTVTRLSQHPVIIVGDSLDCTWAAECQLNSGIRR